MRPDYIKKMKDVVKKVNKNEKKKAERFSQSHYWSEKLLGKRIPSARRTNIMAFDPDVMKSEKMNIQAQSEQAVSEMKVNIEKNIKIELN